jgi:phenylalanyl-tRNA synthetase beta chain
VAGGELTVAGVDQPMRVAGLVHGSVDALQWSGAERGVDFYDVKGDVEAVLAPRQPRFVAAVHPALHPGRCARIELEGRPIGFVGELHPKWQAAYDLPGSAPVLFEIDLAAVLEVPVPEFEPVPRQQAVWRDLALVVGDQVIHDALLDSLRADPAGLVRSATLFDIYRPASPVAGLGPGERSLAVRLELLATDGTLTEDRIERTVAAAVARAHTAFGARLRA